MQLEALTDILMMQIRIVLKERYPVLCNVVKYCYKMADVGCHKLKLSFILFTLYESMRK